MFIINIGFDVGKKYWEKNIFFTLWTFLTRCPSSDKADVGTENGMMEVSDNDPE
jgi:hypothetical protein